MIRVKKTSEDIVRLLKISLCLFLLVYAEIGRAQIVQSDGHIWVLVAVDGAVDGQGLLVIVVRKVRLRSVDPILPSYVTGMGGL